MDAQDVQVRRITVEFDVTREEDADEVMSRMYSEIESAVQRNRLVYRLVNEDEQEEVTGLLSRPSDLTDKALAATHRLHDIVHMPGGVYDPERNPGGCDKVFCRRVLLEVPAVVEPAIRADERRRCAEEMAARSRAGGAAARGR